MELTPTQQGSGCGGLVWAQLLQPLSTESACQLLKAGMAKAPKTFIRALTLLLHSEHSSRHTQYLLPVTEDGCFSYKMKGSSVS